MKKYNTLKEMVLTNLMDEMYYEIKNQYKKYPAKSSNLRHIDAAKIIAKKYKIKYQSILKNYNPTNNIQGEKTWDENGNIK